jgi:hypothetical protein
MKLMSGRWLLLALLVVGWAEALRAGQIYGTIVMGGQPVKDARVEIQCGQEAAVSGATAADGAYRINVPQQGQCSLSLPSFEGRPTASVFSSPNPSLFNFELAKGGDGKYELKRR